MKNLIAVLHKIQKDLKAPKNQYNEYGKYKYRSCEDILEAVKQILPEGYTVIVNDSIVIINQRYYVKAEATLTNGEKEIKTTAYAREAENKKGMDEAQLTGATSSYARKYALNGLFLIDDAKDADSHEPSKQGDDLIALIAEVGKINDVNKLTEFYNLHKGKGKELDQAIIKRNKELSAPASA